MGSHGIKDRVAIVGMGCTRFAEHWDKGLDELLLDATGEAFTSTGVSQDDVDAYWLGTAQGGMSGMLLAKPLGLEGKPVTRVENMCATGSEALRQASYAVASGAYDLAMAVGVEKVKDSGYQGLNAFPVPNDGTQRTLTAAAMFSMVAPAYADAVRRADGRAQGGAGADRVEEPPQRSPEPAGAVPPRDVRGADPRHARGGGVPLGVRLRWGGRRRGGRHRLPRRGRPPLHGLAALREGALVRRRQRLRPHRSRLRLHDLPGDRAMRRGRLRPGRGHEPACRARHGGGARLLHAHRARAHGGPRVLRARHRLEGDPGGRLRPRRATSP